MTAAAGSYYLLFSAILLPLAHAQISSLSLPVKQDPGCHVAHCRQCDTQVVRGDFWEKDVSKGCPGGCSDKFWTEQGYGTCYEKTSFFEGINGGCCSWSWSGFTQCLFKNEQCSCSKRVTNPNSCIQCEAGFETPATGCSQPKCGGCKAYSASTGACKTPCSGHGTCTAPNTCACDTGYTGADCGSFLNRKPTSVALSTTTVREGAKDGSTVATVLVTDPDEADAHTCAIVQKDPQFAALAKAEGPIPFEITHERAASLDDEDPRSPTKVETANLLVVVNSTALDFEGEGKGSWTFAVRCTDLVGVGQMAVTQLLTVRLVDVNEPPTSLRLSSSSVSEGAAVGSVVARLFTTDPDANESLTYAVVLPTWDYSPYFLVVPGSNALKLAKSLDHESQPTVTFTARVTDRQGHTLEATFTVSVVDANDKPSDIHLADFDEPSKRLQAPFKVQENKPAGLVLAYLVTDDPDIDNPPGGSTPSAGGSTTTTTTTSTGSGAWPYKTRHHARHTYSIVGAGSPFLAINGNTLITTGPISYEAQKVVSATVRSTDAGGLFVERRFDFDVQDVNEAPATVLFAGGKVASVQEKAPSGTVVGKLVAIDPENDQTHTFALEPGYPWSSNFRLEGNSSDVLVVADGAGLDYEGLRASSSDGDGAATITLRIRVTDDGSPPLSTLADLSINILDVNEPPTGIALPPQMDPVPENTPVGTIVGTLVVTDPEASQTHRCVVVGSSPPLRIDGLDIVVAKPLDHETYGRFLKLQVRCEDDGAPPRSLTSTIEVAITNVNEPPVAVALAGASSIFTNTTVGTAVGRQQKMHARRNRQIRFQQAVAISAEVGPEHFGAQTNFSGSPRSPWSPNYAGGGPGGGNNVPVAVELGSIVMDSDAAGDLEKGGGASVPIAATAETDANSVKLHSNPLRPPTRCAPIKEAATTSSYHGSGDGDGRRSIDSVDSFDSNYEGKAVGSEHGAVDAVKEEQEQEQEQDQERQDGVGESNDSETVPPPSGLQLATPEIEL
eukprot:g1652.t1